MQSKDIIKQVRIEPDTADTIGRVCFRFDVSFSEFARRALKLASIYYPYIDALMQKSVKDEIVALVVAQSVIQANTDGP